MEFTLHCGDTTARVRQKGAQMTSFKGNDNREVIWQADPAVWGNHAPVLFPICGTAKDNHVIIDGVSYPIAKHGFSRNPEFTARENRRRLHRACSDPHGGKQAVLPV